MKFLINSVILLFCIGLTTIAGAQEVTVQDEDGEPTYTEFGDWNQSGGIGWEGTNYRFTELASIAGPAHAIWRPDIPGEDFYEVTYGVLKSNNRATDIPITINHADGMTTISISQFSNSIVVDEIPLGTYRFTAGTDGFVRMDNTGSTGAYIADAVIFRSTTPQPPVVGVPEFITLLPQADDPIIVSAAVSGDAPITSVSAHYAVQPGGLSGEVTANDSGTNGDETADDGIWTATLPGQPDNSDVSVYFEATDSQPSTSTGPLNSITVGLDTPEEFRVIWIDTWNTGFRSAAQIDQLLATCRANNINTVMPEVRKVGDAYYNSNIEPRANNISGASFDPLAYILEQAHDTSGGKRRIDVHAWFVMHRITTTGSFNAPTHVINTNPEYRMSDRDGNLTGDKNIFLDPGHPGTVEHNLAVILDCLQNYDIDGINLDYIRYPEDDGDWGYNPVSIERFNNVYNKSGTPEINDPDWADWRRENVTLEVRKIYVKTAMIKPDVIITADTINWGSGYSNFEFSRAYSDVYQDWVGWLQDGILDYNCVMNYVSANGPNDRFEGWVDLSLQADDGRGSIIGLGPYLKTNSLAGSLYEINYSRAQGAQGMNFFDWGSETSQDTTGLTQQQFYSQLRDQVFTEWAVTPKPTWKLQPVESIIQGNVTANGVPVDHAHVSLFDEAGYDTVTDGVGWYGVMKVQPGPHIILFEAEGYSPVFVNVTNTLTNGTITNGEEIITVNVDLVNDATPDGKAWLTR